MANELDEMNANVNPAGRDVNVIEKQLTVTTTFAETFLCVWLPWFLLILPGLILWFKRMGARNYFLQLQQKLQAEASQIDNYLEQRVVILQNVAALVNKAVELDKDVMKAVAAFRGGAHITEENRNSIAETLNGGFARLFPQVEAYPELKSHASIADAMQQNSYLQKEITAARALYNDTVTQWNTCIYELPVRKIVAAANHYTTRIPFTASAETKAQARGVFF
ncbi:MAG: LemA family protein [Victivallales bacterium]|nr:LemA family protein [Victivallales bacterium]